MILAGDIGGTKTILSLIRKEADQSLSCIAEQAFPSSDFASLEEILELFLKHQPPVGAACFGVAGPVINQTCKTTNLPWSLDAAQLKIKLGVDSVKLLNDLEAMALGMLHLRGEDYLELNPQAEAQTGNIAVIAAGTGLGEAILYWDGERFHAMATEGGHSDFAPQNPQQDELLNYLRGVYPEHVSYERILSGIGFSHLYDFLIAAGYGKPCPAVPPVNSAIHEQGDRNAVISRLGLNDEDPVCREVMRLFVEIYGGEAGNLALKAFATGGVYIGGGIAPKIKAALETGEFMQAFANKGRFQAMLQKTSVKLALNPRTPLLGAINFFG